jgi:pSer/pThr/pTyr-binding forkhead associated (FHA) protein
MNPPPTGSPGTKARLVVIRGLMPNWEYPLFDGPNIIGRAEEQPVEIDVGTHEPEDGIYSSLQHACINWDGHTFTVEDLGSANGTQLNNTVIQAGEKSPLKPGDLLQIGDVQLQLAGDEPYQMARWSSGLHADPRLLAVRGLQPNREYFIFDGENIIGRGDQQPVEIDLQEQESDYRVWVSRRHARITRERDSLLIEDLYSANATYVNRRRVAPGVKRCLRER